MMRRQIERYGRWLLAIFVLMAAAVVCGSYILIKQRLSLPLQDRYTIEAEFEATGGLTPGLGQAVNVAGVRVGTVLDTSLDDGRSITKLEIDPAKLARVRRDASARLIPNTALKDMLIELSPGRDPQSLGEGERIHVANTTPPVDADELTSALDRDTRDFFELLVGGADRGTRGRGRDLREMFKALGPTAEGLRDLTGALAARRRELKRLVTNLAILGRELEGHDRETQQVVEGASAILTTLGDQEAALRAAIRDLPPTLATARSTLAKATEFADELTPTLERLRPAIRKLPAALRATRPLLDEAEPILRTRLRPLVREIQPLVKDLAPTTTDLSAVTPQLVTAFQILNYTVNTLAYNPPGDNEGGLFWTAWFAHNAASVTSLEDAHGAVVRGLVLFDCKSLTFFAPLLDPILGALPAC